MADKEYEIQIHTEINIKTITEFIQDPIGIALFFKSNKNKFLDYSGGSGLSNMERIFKVYTFQEKKDNPKGYSMELLKMNTSLVVPKSEANRELLSISGKNQFVEQKDFNAFYGKSLLQLLKDPLYRAKNRFKYNTNDSLTYINPTISVWVYSGALNEIINVTSYIISCSINVNPNGGSFNLSLPPVINLEGQELYKVGETFYSSNNIRNELLNKNNDFYFHKFIQTNDIVFIKFEELELENRNEGELDSFIINKSSLSGQIYDMIGLVDTNSQNVNFSANDISISISGRDFMKLLIDDCSYFMPLMFVNGGATDVFINQKDNDKLIKRTFTDGKFTSMFAFSMRSVSQSIQFIINQLASLGVLDESVDLFSSYGERRTKVYRTEDNKELHEKLHIGVWQIIKLLIDENVSDRRVADSSISQPDGALITQFQKLCQEPFVEFFGDTYGDFYNLIVRQPPYTKTQILSVINETASDINELKYTKEGIVKNLKISAGVLTEVKTDLLIDIEGEDVISESLSWENEQMYSWFEITPQGSFIGTASQFALAYIPIVYLPQYADKWGLKKMSVVSNYISYQSLSGKDSNINRDYLKEAIINDFKFMIDSSSYLPFTRKGTISMNGDRRIKRGTWIRYKGTGEIYYVDSVSNEFSINDQSIDRVTVLNVSRGMVEKYTKGAMTYFDIVNTDFIKNVLIEKLTTGGVTTSQHRINIKSDFGVNPDAFNFFYQRKQFS